jgi:choline dehydrogenase-like flavoprotein
MELIEQTLASSWLTPEEMRILEVYCDTLIPSVEPPTGETDVAGFYARPGSELHLAEHIASTLAAEPPQMRNQLKQFLALLQNPFAGLILLGEFRSFMQMLPEKRASWLSQMSTSSLPLVRQGFQALKRLAMFLFYATLDVQGSNPNWPALGYAREAKPEPPTSPKRISPLSVTHDLQLTADVVIIGSGAGGSVIAAELAAAKKDVLLLEKGDYYTEEDFSGYEADMTPKLYLRRGILATDNHGLIVVAGSCLGGGTVVNWSTSLRTPMEVLEEWESEYGISGATTAEYQRGFEVIEKRLGINVEDSEPNPNNAALQRGCQALHYDWQYIPRNASGCQQRCGSCGYGCRYGRKQSTLLTFLQDAYDQGARIIVKCVVERIIMKANQVVGIEGWASDAQSGRQYKVVVHAPTVIAAAGAIESPALLQRSGISNLNIGRHLHLHPVAVVFGYYEEPIEAWRGSLQTIYSSEFAHLTGHHGVRFEAAPLHPGMFGLLTPWENGQAHKQMMKKSAYAAAFVILTHDTSSGSIKLDKSGNPTIHYWPNQTDRHHLVRGMQEITRIAIGSGAVGINMLHTPSLSFQHTAGRKSLERFLEEIAQRGVVLNRLPLFSAHQMGTCRLGSSSHNSVADPYGQVYGVRGLFIADASGFPTAVGVNPMLSITALAYRVAQQVKAQT